MAYPFFERMLKSLSPEARERFKATQEWYVRDVAEATQFTDAELVRKVRYYMANSAQAQKWAPGEVVYDAALWHVLVPELLKRLGEPRTMVLPDDVLRAADKYLTTQATNLATLNLAAYIGERVIALIAERKRAVTPAPKEETI